MEGEQPGGFGDDSSIYFYRAGRPLDDRTLRSGEVWVMSARGKEPARLATLEPQSSLVDVLRRVGPATRSSGCSSGGARKSCGRRSSRTVSRSQSRPWHPPLAPSAGEKRLDAIDAVRGAVMVLMLLDHTRDFTHATGLPGRPAQSRDHDAAALS
jgi:hypothetical protein